MKKQPTAKKTTAATPSRPVARKSSRTTSHTPTRTSKAKRTYSSFAYRRRSKKEERERRLAEDLATLPKQPILRFLAHLHPKRVFKYWFSRRGLMMGLKIIGVFILLCAIGVGGLFMYFKKDLAAIRPEELANRVNGTVNTYLDRNGEVLWEDKGDGDYRLVVEGDEISAYMRQATVAAEDRRFYEHIGVDFIGLARAFIATVSGKQVQGGSTLTQQLIKQVYFSDEAANRDMSGIPRKIKETILAIEIERMYDKEQIITLYLNESPYGGRRNGVESGARTYFGKAAKDLTLAESALLAAIPNNPTIFNPYNKDYINDDGTVGSDLNKNGIKDIDELLIRQRYTLDVMADLGYITQDEAYAAKEVDILASILPESTQYKDIKAPHFVLEVKKQLEEELGVRTMRAGGFTITTTLDLRAQMIAEDAVRAGADVIERNWFNVDNIALSSVDVETGQVIAMVGSIDWNRPGYGQTNAATSLLEPGSTIKPVLDYAPLFQEREGQNFGPGSVLLDENIDSLYCAGNQSGPCQLRNFSGNFNGDVTIRTALGSSLNIPAVKAFYINGGENAVEINQKLGNLSWCANGEYVSLAISIGQGCAVRPIEHANAYATFARGGTYKPLAYYLEVKNSSGDVIKRWENGPGERAIDEQVAYMISNILSDFDARKLGFGWYYDTTGLVIPGVWTGVKTGTTDKGAGYAKDNWVAMYSPSIATTVWAGNHDGSPWTDPTGQNLTSYIPRTAMQVYMERVHHEVYGPEGKWWGGMEPARPSGIQTLTVAGRTDIWPSWYNSKTSGISKENMTFDKISKRRATECTPGFAKVEIEVSKIMDPITKKEKIFVEGYDAENTDDIHKCTDTAPTIDNLTATYSSGNNRLTVSFDATSGGQKITKYEIYDDNGKLLSSGNYPASGQVRIENVTTAPNGITLIITDYGGWTAEADASV